MHKNKAEHKFTQPTGSYIEDRVLMLAEYIVENGATVRNAAKKYNVSKSTVHMVVIK